VGCRERVIACVPDMPHGGKGRGSRVNQNWFPFWFKSAKIEIELFLVPASCRYRQGGGLVVVLHMGNKKRAKRRITTLPPSIR
jgi:hypothetical protein